MQKHCCNFNEWWLIAATESQRPTPLGGSWASAASPWNVSLETPRVPDEGFPGKASRRLWVGVADSFPKVQSVIRVQGRGRHTLSCCLVFRLGPTVPRAWERRKPERKQLAFQRWNCHLGHTWCPTVFWIPQEASLSQPKSKPQPGMVAHICSPSPWEAEETGL